MQNYKYIFIGVLICLLSNAKAGDSLNYRKYDVKTGMVRYDVFEIGSKNKIYSFDITFNNFGGEELITLYKEDTIKYYYKNSDKQSSLQYNNCINEPRIWTVYNELFVVDSKSFLYSGIQLFKNTSVKYMKRKCTKYLHYNFDKLDLNGTVTYFHKIPVEITLIDNQKKIIIKAYDISLIE